MGKAATAENKWIPEFDEGRKPFEGWAARTWNWYWLNGLNELKPPDEIGMPLTEKEKELYEKSLKWLREEREKNPGVPIAYEMVETETK